MGVLRSRRVNAFCRLIEIIQLWRWKNSVTGAHTQRYRIRTQEVSRQNRFLVLSLSSRFYLSYIKAYTVWQTYFRNRRFWPVSMCLEFQRMVRVPTSQKIIYPKKKFPQKTRKTRLLTAHPLLRQATRICRPILLTCTFRARFGNKQLSSTDFSTNNIECPL